MKKIYGLIVVSALTAQVFGQNYNSTTPDQEARLKNEINASFANEAQTKFHRTKFSYGLKVDKSRKVSGHLNFVEAIDKNASGADLSISYLTILPDTAVMIEYGDPTNGYTYGKAFNHGSGGIFDPTFKYFHPEVFSIKDTVFVDTIYIHGIYFRNRADADNLNLEVIVAPPTAKAGGPFDNVFYPAGTFPNIPATDQAEMITMKYSGSTSLGYHQGLTGQGSTVQKFTHALTGADSGGVAIGFAVNLTLLPGRGVGFMASFEPESGTYSEGDTTKLNALEGPNAFRTAIGVNTLQSETSCYFLQYYKETTNNTNQHIFSDTRFKAWTGSDAWRNNMTSSSSTFANYVTFAVRGNSTSLVGIQDVNSVGFEVAQNFPNPFSEVSSINYEIAKASRITIEIYDITGKSIMLINEGVKEAGAYKVDVDGSNLNSGIYYYTFRTDNSQVTKKMMIQH